MKRHWRGHPLVAVGLLAVVVGVVGLSAESLLAMGGKRHEAARTTAAAALRHGNGPEALLAEALREIGASRLGEAHEQVDRLLQATPNFRLAQLVKGDLLMSRVRPLTAPGSASGAPDERLADLRAEALAHLQRQRLVAPADRLPANVLRLSPEQKHAVVVDTARSTLYLFENRDGTPHYVADYYITIGRNGTDKAREGDKRTPLGVYHVTANLPRNRLTDFYGSGAFPINYPNEWDRRHGREGHGIWLHGTPSDTFSRPPRASDGCVVLTNRDLEAVGRHLQPGLTPVVIAGELNWSSQAELAAVRGELEAAVEAWRQDWESLRTDAYLGHYAASFAAGSAGFARWAAQKRQVNAAKSWAKVRLDDLSLFLYPGKDDLAVATFNQDYRSSNLSSQMRKRVYWLREGGRWKIIHEDAA